MGALTEQLDAWLRQRLEAQATTWLDGRREALAAGYTDRALHITLGMIPRRLGKHDLALEDRDLARARTLREGVDPSLWSVADAARVLVLLETADAGNQSFTERFVDLCRSADVAELIALYRGLPLYPDAEALEEQAAEGLRTNMRSVFEAVAHRSPYPRERFSTERWNQMVLKALFIGSSLTPIQGLDERANAELARILCDYAHERWAAHRDVTPQLWRCVGPFAEGPMLEDLARTLEHGTNAEQCAAALALSTCAHADAAPILATAPPHATGAAAGAISWHDIDAMSA